VFGSVKLLGCPEELVGNPLARTLSGRFELFAAEIEQSRKLGLAEAAEQGVVNTSEAKNGGLKPGLGWRTARFLATVEDAVTAAQHEFVRQLIGQSNTRREIVAVRTDQPARAVSLNREFGGERRSQLRILSARNDQRKRV